jgi:hypothetical protein
MYFFLRPSFGGGFALKGASHIFQAGHTQKVKLQHLQDAPAGPPSGIELQQKRANQRQVNLGGHSLGRLGQPMPAAQHAFDPAEEQFHLPMRR